MKRRAFLSAAAVLGLGGRASAENWPGWRGPLGNGQSSEKNLPVRWTATSDNIRWKTPLPSPGTPNMSSPIVWGDRIFLTHSLDASGKQRTLLCFDRKDGKELWRKVVEYTEREATYDGEKHYCSASPATDGERVVVWYGSAGVYCYDLQGAELWKRDLGKADHIWGNASSPVIYGDQVFLNFGPGERSFLTALDKKTGQDVWKVEKSGNRGANPSFWVGAWCTPLISRSGERDELIMAWPLAVEAYEPKTGQQLWRCEGLGKLVYASPLATEDTVLAMSGFGGPYMAVKRGGSGDVTATHRRWQMARGPQRVGSGVIVGDYVHILNTIGTAQCIELQTGRTVYEERVGAGTWGSMVHADGRLYATNQRGETLVLAASPTFELISRNPLEERTQSSPAISEGDVFIRTYEHLWCIGKK